jgi:hypothetical protein
MFIGISFTMRQGGDARTPLEALPDEADVMLQRNVAENKTGAG